MPLSASRGSDNVNINVVVCPDRDAPPAHHRLRPTAGVAPLLHMQSQPSGKQAQRLAESHTDLPVSETQKGRYRTHESVYEGQTRGQGRALTHGGYSGRPQGDRGVPVHGHPTWHAFDWKRSCPSLPLPSSGRQKKMSTRSSTTTSNYSHNHYRDQRDSTWWSPRYCSSSRGFRWDGLQKQAKSTGPQ